MARYKDAIEWIAANDDTEFMDDPDFTISVTLAFVIDLFNKTQDEAVADLRKALKQIESKGNAR